MSVVEAAVLGLVQGLGEFLPISSSAHLILVPWLLGWPEHGLAFDVALHVGTLAAVLAAFAADWWQMAAATARGIARGRPFAEPGGRLLGLLALASVPGAVCGLLLEHWAETVFRSPGLVACLLALMGGVLYVADRLASGRRGEGEMSVLHAVAIGAAQALAVVPGVSRSGATISAALLLGYRREEAARFSFLLATPITAGAALLKARELLHAQPVTPILVGMVVALVAGLASIRLLLRYVRSGSYRPFVYYRWALAALVGLVLLVRS